MFDRKPPMVTQVRCDGHEYVLSMPYHSGLVAAMNQLRASFVSAKDHPAAKTWRVPVSVGRTLPAQVPDLLKACAFKFHETEATLEAKLLAAERAPEPGLLLHRFAVTLYAYVIEASGEDPGETGVVAMAPLHRGFNALCQKSGGHWQSPLKGWIIEGADPVGFRATLTQELGLAPDQIQIMDSVYKLQQRISAQGGGSALDWVNAKPVREGGGAGVYNHEVLLPDLPPRGAGPVPASQVEPLLARYVLDDYQKDGARHLLRFSSSLLADDMGLGKTRQSIVAADIARGGRPALVVCPASPVLNWKREIEMVAPGAFVAVREFDPRAQWVVTNYERVGAMTKIAHKFSVVIFDEAHVIKNPAAARTRESFTLAQKIPCRMVLTGTPLLNSISEIHTLLRLSGHPLGNSSFRTFAEEWGDRLLELHQQLRDWMLRRDKSTVLSLPGKHRHFLPFSLEDEDAVEHNRIMRDASMEAYVKITRLREGLERWKLPFLENLLRQLGPDDKLIVFCEYTSSVDSVLDLVKRHQCEGVGIKGATSIVKRNEAVERFQTDPQCRVFVGTTAVAGVAITLTAANHVLVLGMPWTWGILEQAEDRAFRRGQKRRVDVHIPVVRKSIDEHIMGIIDGKRDVGSKVVMGQIAEAIQIPDPVSCESAA